MALNFIAPKVREGITIAKLQQKEVHKLQEEWEYVVVLYVVGDRPLNFHMQCYIKAQWSSIQPSKVVSHSKGYFIIKLRNTEVLTRVPEGESYFMYQHIILLKQWKINFDFKKEILLKLPI